MKRKKGGSWGGGIRGFQMLITSGLDRARKVRRGYWFRRSRNWCQGSVRPWQRSFLLAWKSRSQVRLRFWFHFHRCQETVVSKLKLRCLEKLFKPRRRITNEIIPNLNIHNLVRVGWGSKDILSDGMSSAEIKTTCWGPVGNHSRPFKLTEISELPRILWFYICPGLILEISEMITNQSKGRQRLWWWCLTHSYQ